MKRLVIVNIMCLLLLMCVCKRGFSQEPSQWSWPPIGVGLAPQAETQNELTIDDIPLPFSTRELKQPEDMRGLTKGNDLNMEVYESELSLEEIRSFYKDKLVSLKWHQMNMSGSLSQMPMVMPGVGLSELRQAMGNNLTFIKSGYVLIVAFMPLNNQDNVRYSVGLRKMPAMRLPVPLEPNRGESKSETVDFMPLYFDIQQMNYTENNNGSVAMYTSGADVETLAQFYKENMQDYSWRLKDDRQEAPKSLANISSDCPTCPKIPPEQQEMMKNLSVEVRTLNFDNSQGDKCSIQFLKTKGLEVMANLSGTSITVTHTKSQ